MVRTESHGMEPDSLVYVAGHRGMVGSALVKALQNHGFSRLLLEPSSTLDLSNSQNVDSFFEKQKPDVVLLAAARVGGILANRTYPAEFIRTNLEIQTNVIHSSWKHNVKRLLFIASACIYPRLCAQPMKEESLLTGHLEPTNAAFAMAKLAGITMCEAYRSQYGVNFSSVIPTNQYGANDNFDPKASHLIGSLVLRFHEAKLLKKPEVILWGTGHPRRDFMLVDDLAETIIFLLKHPNLPDPINIGTGKDLSIAEIAHFVSSAVGYEGKIVFDNNMPDGAPQRLLDVSRLEGLGWGQHTTLADGLARTYQWFEQRYAETRL